MTTTMAGSGPCGLHDLPAAPPDGPHLIPNLRLSTVSRLFNPLSPDLFPPYYDYEDSPNHAALLVRFRGRQWSGLVAASGHFLLSLDTRPARLGRQWSLPRAGSPLAPWPLASSSSRTSAASRFHWPPTSPRTGEMTDRGQPYPELRHWPLPLWRLSPVLGQPSGLSTFPQRRRLLIAPLDRVPPAAPPYPRHSLRGSRWSLVRGNAVVPSYWLGWSLLRGKRH